MEISMTVADTKMNRIIITESSLDKYRKSCYTFLLIDKVITEKHFDWLNLKIEDDKLIGNGNLRINSISYKIGLIYSPFLPFRMERIYVMRPQIQYHKDIHLYGDLSLCLYHPIVDNPNGEIIPLVRMIPWISEWIVYYQEWKKYHVWLGKEIKH